MLDYRAITYWRRIIAASLNTTQQGEPTTAGVKGRKIELGTLLLAKTPHPFVCQLVQVVSVY
jgi:hypothetical protein